MKNHDFQEGKMVAVRHFLKNSNELYIFDGGDLMKIRDFLEGKMVAVCHFLKISNELYISDAPPP